MFLIPLILLVGNPAFLGFGREPAFVLQPLNRFKGRDELIARGHVGNRVWRKDESLLVPPPLLKICLNRLSLEPHYTLKKQ